MINIRLLVIPVTMIYFSITLWLIIRDLKLSGNGWCVYSTSLLQDRSNRSEFEPKNDTLLYVFTNETTFAYAVPKTYGVERCIKGLYHPTDLFAFSRLDSDKVLVVEKMVDCKFYLWFTHTRLIMIIMATYFAYLCMRYARLMFGVCGVSTTAISPCLYPYNYLVFLFSTMVVKLEYYKLNRLFIEHKYHRDLAMIAYRKDPISYMYWNPKAMACLLVETGLHMICHCLVISSLTAFYSPCHVILPIVFKISCGLFTTTYILIESWLMFNSIRQETRVTELSNRPPDQDMLHGPQGVMKLKSGLCIPCCVNILSNVFIRMLYIVGVIAVLFLIVHYEKRIQASLFGE
ncbi:envelope glycoprotein K [Testudinid alphaherpesvirus 3]|uniref:Envelope glycoprotein K n=1 Tax=Testudinid alphaherpesvirus 3 TaxID=2560801 RepID=A0A0K1R1E5_9ALPH|nr:envelope glycoprotein K [Testudinid alphaherpesvirus 3]AIU39248.1 envelope glycoprotein K [Testudinid alphaherpesvirus 3]AIU39358.1 envelope glycoprotein K [Testudinid alphaherpesvirus 3]AKI81634.1 envelope glycoprotein K [Testudinid alphaherpesvirus 3]AKI81738.1 envelope glycoprotein K [Testudinid alphaherpesvirus 3]AKV40718.1 UL53 glycoprotein K [Testudinid alphaherpesvirus 3]